MDTMSTTKAMTTADQPPGHGKHPLCGARKKTAEGTCRRPAGWGTDHVGYGSCKLHGGCTPTVIKGAERERIDQQARKALEGFTDFAPVHDPVERLRMLAGRAEAWMTALEVKVAELTSLRYESNTAEQIRGEIQLYERAMAATGKVLVDLARLNLDERAVKVQEAQVALLAGALTEALAEAGLPPGQRHQITVRVGELVAAAEDQGAALPAGRR
jgi:hypothetical protein